MYFYNKLTFEFSSFFFKNNNNERVTPCIQTAETIEHVLIIHHKEQINIRK